MQRFSNKNGRFAALAACAAIVGGVVVGAAGAGCSFVQFEQSPYTPRDLAVVYSEQENLTFVSWKVGDEADLDEAYFELYQNGEYRRIDLSEAPYPAAPYDCGGDLVCLQYQVDGRLDLDADASPIRTFHESIWGGPTATLRSVAQTFDIAPVAIDNNARIDPGRFDWFLANDVPLRRDYQFQFVTAREQADSCGQVSDQSWQPMKTPTAVDYEWVESPTCFAARPVRRDTGGVVVTTPLRPSAETVSERQVYRPPEQRAPIVYGVLFDLQIADEVRCQRIKTSLTEMISQAFGARGEAELLDIYLPLSSQSGAEIETCNQAPGRYYPAERMMHDAQIAAAHHEPTEVRVVWIYVNNSQIPPSQDVVEGLSALAVPPGSASNLDFYFWAIGSNPILTAGPWQARTGWRPIDDDTFEADIVSFAKNTLPFMTMMHFPETKVSIEAPESPRSPSLPLYFKICTAQPPYAAIGNDPAAAPAFGATSPAIVWPDDADVLPFYTVDLGVQRMVPFGDFRKRRVETVIEVCERFCDHGFRTRGGVDYDNWIYPPVSRPQEVCQWSL